MADRRPPRMHLAPRATVEPRSHIVKVAAGSGRPYDWAEHEAKAKAR